MGSEEHFEEHHAVARWNTGGHPLAWEVLVGGVVAFTGLAFVYIWVATFVWYWALGVLMVMFGGILALHDKPLLSSRASTKKRPGPPP
jgi:hypothetical protein